MNFIIFVFHMILLLICMPFAPVVEDRIIAARRYRQSQLRFCRYHLGLPYWSLQRWLDRAARRQERINAINLPEFIEHQRHQWERWFAYLYAFKKISLWSSLFYGVNRLDPLLKMHSPTVYHCLNTIGLFMRHTLDALIGWLSGQG
ncbi:MAG: hypothetical protein PSV13_08120 [Lacunisphaera sp.]|nr:hypothetical protein [Lacunisphaera sp.]